MVPNTWHEKKRRVKCGVTGCHIKRGSGEENGDSEKKWEGEVRNEATEGNVGARVKITWCGVHAKINTWVKHHP